MLYGGYPSAPLTTRSSARSISSNPRRNGLDNEGTRDIFLQSPLEATLKFRALAAPHGERTAGLSSGRHHYGHDFGDVQASSQAVLEPAKIPADWALSRSRSGIDH